MARQAVASGDAEDAERVATELVESLRAPDLRLALVFADWRFDPHVVARVIQRGLAPAPVVGGTTVGVIARAAKPAPAVLSIAGLGLYGDWLRIGIGIAPDLPKSALTRSRDAVQYAAVALGTTAGSLGGAATRRASASARPPPPRRSAWSAGSSRPRSSRCAARTCSRTAR
jgi:hypothetical protein